MAQRNETTQRKLMMLQDLRAARLQGDGVHNESAISQRELSARYGLSGHTVSLLMQQLVEEGVLYTVPRVGTFLGQPPLQTAAPYIFVSDVPGQFNTYVDHMQAGFYDRVAQLGAAGITLGIEEMEWHLAQGNLNSISGAFFYKVPLELIRELVKCSQTHIVIYGQVEQEESNFIFDTVDFDDEEGGSQAARHLLDRGHRNIAFLGVHTPERKSKLFHWSLDRETGWRKMLQSAGLETEGLSFLPETLEINPEGTQREAGHQAAIKLLQNPQVTAVVASNFYAAQGLLDALKQAEIPTQNWPAIVCFDNAPKGASTGISYLRLPWEKIGAEAAQLLWERKTERTKGITQKRLVRMNLIPRLTSHRDWALSGLAQGQLIQSRIVEKDVLKSTPN